MLMVWRLTRFPTKHKTADPTPAAATASARCAPADALPARRAALILFWRCLSAAGQTKRPPDVREPGCLWRAVLPARGKPRTPVGEPVVAVAAIAGARADAHGIKANTVRGGGQARISEPLIGSWIIQKQHRDWMGDRPRGRVGRQSRSTSAARKRWCGGWTGEQREPRREDGAGAQ
jgi:hypothetical protein